MVSVLARIQTRRRAEGTSRSWHTGNNLTSFAARHVSLAPRSALTHGPSLGIRLLDCRHVNSRAYTSQGRITRLRTSSGRGAMAPRKSRRDPLAEMPENEYEAQRLKIIARNKEKMEQLGLMQAVEDMQATRRAEEAAAQQRRASSKRRAPQASSEITPLVVYSIEMVQSCPSARSPGTTPPSAAPPPVDASCRCPSAQSPVARRQSSRIQSQGATTSYADAFEDTTGFRRRGKTGSSRIPLTLPTTRYTAPFSLRFTGAARSFMQHRP